MSIILLAATLVGIVISAPISENVCKVEVMTIEQLAKESPVIIKGTVMRHNTNVRKTDVKGKPTLIVADTDVMVEIVSKNTEVPCVPNVITLHDTILKDRCKDITNIFKEGQTYFMMIRGRKNDQGDLLGGAEFAVDGQQNFLFANQYNEQLIGENTGCTNPESCGSSICGSPYGLNRMPWRSFGERRFEKNPFWNRRMVGMEEQTYYDDQRGAEQWTNGFRDAEAADSEDEPIMGPIIGIQKDTDNEGEVEPLDTWFMDEKMPQRISNVIFADEIEDNQEDQENPLNEDYQLREQLNSNEELGNDEDQDQESMMPQDEEPIVRDGQDGFPLYEVNGQFIEEEQPSSRELTTENMEAVNTQESDQHLGFAEKTIFSEALRPMIEQELAGEVGEDEESSLQEDEQEVSYSQELPVEDEETVEPITGEDEELQDNGQDIPDVEEEIEEPLLEKNEQETTEEEEGDWEEVMDDEQSLNEEVGDEESFLQEDDDGEEDEEPLVLDDGQGAPVELQVPDEEEAQESLDEDGQLPVEVEEGEQPLVEQDILDDEYENVNRAAEEAEQPLLEQVMPAEERTSEAILDEEQPMSEQEASVAEEQSKEQQVPGQEEESGQLIETDEDSMVEGPVEEQPLDQDVQEIDREDENEKRMLEDEEPSFEEEKAFDNVGNEHGKQAEIPPPVPHSGDIQVHESGSLPLKTIAAGFQLSKKVVEGKI